MKTHFTIICLLLFCLLQAKAQTFEVDTIKFNGATDQHINFVFLADGYQEHELNQFIVDVEKMVAGIFSETPYKEYKSYFNVFAVKVPSNESGASHPGDASDELTSGGQPTGLVDNYFGSMFDYAGIHRLLVPTNDLAIATVLANNFPEYDQVFVLVNTPYYGGSGGAYATSSTHEASAEIAIHEIGHSFGGLADEYWAGEQYAWERPNLTQVADPVSIKWKNWLNDNGVGIYAHEESPSWYRPHQICNMRYLSTASYPVDFCSVCSETLIERVHALVTPLKGWEPMGPTKSRKNVPMIFSIDQIKPEPNTLITEWSLNGEVIATNGDQLKLDQDKLQVGHNALIATFYDQTLLSRDEEHVTLHVYTVTWQIDHKKGGISFINQAPKKNQQLKQERVTSITSAPVAQQIQLAFYPNPTSNVLNVEYKLEKDSNVEIQLLSLDGKLIDGLKSSQKDCGLHQQQLSLRKLSAGTYLVRVLFNGGTVTKKIVKGD